MKVYAFIPARSGSKGLPDKNILPIAGHPLLAYAVKFGLKLGIDKVIVSTDIEQYAEIAQSYGAECPHLRCAEASSDTAMEEDIIADMAARFPEFGIDMPDIWVRLKPTNPFRSVESVKSAIEKLTSNDTIDSVRIVSEADCRLVTINQDGFLEPLMDIWDRSRSVMRRTEFPKAYSPFNLDLFRHSNWRRLGRGYMGARIAPIIEHAVTGVDINNADDFELVKAIVESKPRPAFLKKYIVEMN